MWTLVSPELPVTKIDYADFIGAPLAITNTGDSLAPVASVNLSSGALSTTASLALPTTLPNGSITLTQPNTLSSTSVLAQGRQLFTPAQDTSNPQSGEFVQVGTQITLYYAPSQLVPGLSLQVIGADATKLPTNYVDPNLFQIFWGLPVVGKISWGISAEQHPTGSIALGVFTTDIALVRTRFRKGTELEFAGVGFSVANYKEKLESLDEFPGGFYTVNISLNGKWARRKYQQPSLFAASSMGAGAYQDPDCQLGATSSNSSAQSTISVQALAQKVGVPFTPYGTIWSVTIPSNSPPGSGTKWADEAAKRLRVNGAFMDWSRPSGPRAVSINSVRSSSVQVQTLDITQQGDFEHSDGHFGYAVEYPNTKLDGQFSNPNSTSNKENTLFNNKPKFKQRKRVTQTLKSGSANPNTPPENCVTLKDTSLNWDTSGPTKTYTETTTIDGMPSRKLEVIWGLAYTALDISSGGKIVPANAAAFWKIVSRKETTFTYDDKTGYATGWTCTGWRLGRFKTESTDKPETLSNLAAAKLKPYQFQQISIISKNAAFLVQFLDFYNDVPPPSDLTYKACNRDGTSSIRFMDDPNAVPSFFVLEELTYTNCFARLPNPDSTSAKPLPDLCTGEETLQQRKLDIYPSPVHDVKHGRILSAGDATEKLIKTFYGSEDQPDRYTEWNLSDSAQNAQFQDKAVEETFDEHEGRPSPASKLPPLFEKEEPEKGDPNEEDESEQYEYRLTTPGYNPNTSVVQGSVSYEVATTAQIALEAAKLDLYLNDLQQSVQFDSVLLPFDAQLRPMDRLTIQAGADSYSTRITNCSNSVTLEGSLEGIPVLTSDGTSVTCGIDRTIPVTMTKVKVPSSNTSNGRNAAYNFNVINEGLTLGSLFDVSQFKSRGNY